MILYLGALLLLCLWGIKFSGFREDYISKEQSGSFKGIFAMMIFLSHIRSFVSAQFPGDRLYSEVFTLLGQMTVVMFFFYSGFGIMESIKCKPGYMHGFFKNRIVKLILDYNIVSLAYMLYRTCTGTFFSWDRYLLSWCGWETVADVNARGNWFMFVILQLYLITLLMSFLLRRVFRQDGKKYQYLLTVTVMILSVGFMYLLHCSGRGEYWYNTLFVYGFGMLYAVLRKRIEKAMRKTVCYLAALAAVCAGVGVILLLDLTDVISYSVMSCLFAAFLTLISMHVRIQNPVLVWLGKLCFSIYILQKVSMVVFRDLGLSSNPVLYGAACIAVTLLLSQLHYMVAGKVSGALLRKQKVS